MKEFALAVVSVGGLVIIFVLLQFVDTVDLSDPKLDSVFWIKNIGGWVATLAAGGLALLGVQLALKGVSAQISAGRELQRNDFLTIAQRATQAAWQSKQMVAARLQMELQIQSTLIFSRDPIGVLKRAEVIVGSSLDGYKKPANLRAYPLERIMGELPVITHGLPLDLMRSVVEYTAKLHHEMDKYLKTVDELSELTGIINEKFSKSFNRRLKELEVSLADLDKECFALRASAEIVLSSNSEEFYLNTLSSIQELTTADDAAEVKQTEPSGEP